MKELLQHLKTYLQLHHDQNDGGVHINLIARINEELEKPDTDLDYWHVVQEINKFIDRSNIGFCKAEALLEKVDAELAKPEPVAWKTTDIFGRALFTDSNAVYKRWIYEGMECESLYTHPPAQQKPLTDEQIDNKQPIPTTEPCPHENTDVGWDHVTCLDCGWVNKGPVIGPNRGWFPSLAAQEEFKKYNTYPGIHDIKPTRKIKAK